MARDPWEELAEELVHGSEEEFVAALTERMMQLLVEGCENPDEFAAIASRSRELALGVWAEHSREVTAETEAAFMEALSAEQEVLEATLAEAFGEVPGLTARGRNEVNQAARGMSEILGRQNVALADNLADEWWHATSDAVTRIQMGDALQDVVRDGARRLAAAGLETIDYRSGVHTTIDAAVRRHAITQQNQCRNDMLARDCRAYGVELVFTSAHWGARPTHAEWQGKPYGLDGPCEVDGVKYEGLADATGYGTVAGLAGASCRHRIHPYVPGITKLPDTDFAEFEAKYHMSSDEYYEATQRQRALERQIRATKREIALGEAHGADMTEDRYRLGAQQKRLREHCARTGLPRDRSREQAYAVADKDGTEVSIFHQPRALTSAKAYPVGATPVKNGRRVFPATRGPHDIMSDLSAVNPQHSSDLRQGLIGYTRNCQRCVVTYEMRRRGYDVVAKPAEHMDPREDPIATKWWSCFIGGTLRQCGSGNGRSWIEHYASSWEIGARAIVSVVWKDSDSGHAFMAEMTADGLVFLDPQSGAFDVSSYFDLAKDGGTYIMRTDRLKPSNRIDDCCTSRKKGGRRR